MTPQELPLRDIHLPNGVSAWPPAPGWWLLLVILVMIAILIWALREQRRRQALRKRALAELRGIEQAFARHGDAQRLAGDCSVLLRRVAISRFPRHEVAGLTGQAWLAFLNQSSQTQPFADTLDQALLQAPYQAQTEAEIHPQTLLAACRQWLQQLPPGGRS